MFGTQQPAVWQLNHSRGHALELIRDMILEADIGEPVIA